MILCWGLVNTQMEQMLHNKQAAIPRLTLKCGSSPLHIIPLISIKLVIINPTLVILMMSFKMKDNSSSSSVLIPSAPNMCLVVWMVQAHKKSNTDSNCECLVENGASAHCNNDISFLTSTYKDRQRIAVKTADKSQIKVFCCRIIWNTFTWY